MELIKKKKKKITQKKPLGRAHPSSFNLFFWPIIFIVFLAYFVFQAVNKLPSAEVKLFEWKKEEGESYLTISDLTEQEIEELKKKELVFTWFPFEEKRNIWTFKVEEDFLFFLKKNIIYFSIDSLTREELIKKKVVFEDKKTKKSCFSFLPSAVNIKLDEKYCFQVFAQLNSEKKWEKNIIKSSFTSFMNLLFIFFIFLLVFSVLLGVNLFEVIFSSLRSLSKDAVRSQTEITMPKTTFKDVIGLESAKEELREVIDFFFHPEIFIVNNIQTAKGILLIGPPGNGKTLLAKALASECGVPFIACSGSEFEEVFAGLGARRVRNLFYKARSFEKGCIIFFDEFDSIASKRYERGSSVTGVEHTLNQLLAELDGFKTNEKVFVLAATNNYEVLDPAVTRPGRFDKRLFIDIKHLFCL